MNRSQLIKKLQERRLLKKGGVNAVLTQRLIQNLSDRPDVVVPQPIDNTPVLSELLGKVSVIQGEKGDRGDVGPRPSDAQLLALIRPLIPRPIKGDTPSDTQLLKLIRPLIRNGTDGHTPTKQELLEIIMPLVPDPIPGNDGSPDTPEQVIAKVNRSSTKIKASQIDVESLPKIIEKRDMPNISIFPGRSSMHIEVLKDGIPYGQDIRKINFKGAAIAIARTGDGVIDVTVTATASGGMTGSWVDIDGTIDGVNTVFTLHGSPTPVGDILLHMARQIQFTTLDYTIVGSTITYVVPPDAGLSGEPHKAYVFVAS